MTRTEQNWAARRRHEDARIVVELVGGLHV